MRAKIPVNPYEVQEGSDAFRAHEKRDAIYKVSTFLVDHFWGDPNGKYFRFMKISKGMVKSLRGKVETR
jgi:hypothetical protein